MPSTVSDLLPQNYDNYMAIFWVPGIIENFPFEEIVQPPNTIDQINTNVRIWNEFKIEFNSVNEEIYRETTFVELSELFKKSYDLQIVNALPWETKGIEILWSQTKQKLERIINLLASNEKLDLHFRDYFRWNGFSTKLPIDKEFTRNVSKNDFFNLMAKTFFDATLHLYPPSKEWCLINFEDYTFNILAYSNSMENKVNNLKLSDTLKLSNNHQLSI